MSTLNDACFCYGYVMNGLATNNVPERIQAEALDVAEKLRKSICEQFGKRSNTPWLTILRDAGVDEDSSKTPEGEERYRVSLEQGLNEEGCELFSVLEDLRFSITGKA